jgi:hypothetical protein
MPNHMTKIKANDNKNSPESQGKIQKVAKFYLAFDDVKLQI